MAFIKVGEENSSPIELYYEDQGRGQPVVLIHGFPLNGASWEKQVEVLLNDGYRVITYDRRGFGLSTKCGGEYNYDTFADDLNILLSKLNLQDVVLVGFSMGTGEVARFLSTYGVERISKAVMIGPIPPFILKSEENKAGVDIKVFEGIKEAIHKDRLAFLVEFFKNFYNTDVFLGKKVSQEVLDANFIVASSASAKATYDCVSTWMTDFRRDLPSIKVPLLIIQGDADRILPFKASGELLAKAINGSKLVTIKDGPHAICWTHAEEVNNELLDFLSGEEGHAARDVERDAGLGLS